MSQQSAKNASAKGYWRRVLRGAWEETYQPLQWNRQKVALVLTAIGTILAAGLHLGLGEMITTLIGYVWIAAPVAFAALILFIWGVIQTQATMNRELIEARNENKRKIGELETKLANSRPAPPDYEKWKHRQSLTLRTAAQLWEGERPGMKLIGAAKETYEMLHGAIQSGALDLDLDDPSIDPRMRETTRRLRRQNPNAETLVTRTALRAFALSNGYDPEFLRE
jgi:hypothetical protein